MTNFQRTYWHSDTMDLPEAPDSDQMDDDCGTRRRVDTAEESNLVGSWCAHNAAGPDGHPQVVGLESDRHLPVIDLDLPVQLVPSSTPGCFHLFIDHPVRWGDFAELLQLLARMGIVEQGYADASIDRGMAFVRTRPSKPRNRVADKTARLAHDRGQLPLGAPA